MLAKEHEADSEVEVRWEDQRNINEFGRLNTRLLEIKEERAILTKHVEDLEDVEEFIMLADGDDALRLKIGDTFVEADEDAVGDVVNAKREVKYLYLISVRF